MGCHSSKAGDSLECDPPPPAPAPQQQQQHATSPYQPSEPPTSSSSCGTNSTAHPPHSHSHSSLISSLVPPSSPRSVGCISVDLNGNQNNHNNSHTNSATATTAHAINNLNHTPETKPQLIAQQEQRWRTRSASRSRSQSRGTIVGVHPAAVTTTPTATETNPADADSITLPPSAAVPTLPLPLIDSPDPPSPAVTQTPANTPRQMPEAQHADTQNGNDPPPTTNAHDNTANTTTPIYSPPLPPPAIPNDHRAAYTYPTTWTHRRLTSKSRETSRSHSRTRSIEHTIRASSQSPPLSVDSTPKACLAPLLTACPVSDAQRRQLDAFLIQTKLMTPHEYARQFPLFDSHNHDYMQYRARWQAADVESKVRHRAGWSAQPRSLLVTPSSALLASPHMAVHILSPIIHPIPTLTSAAKHAHPPLFILPPVFHENLPIDFIHSGSILALMLSTSRSALLRSTSMLEFQTIRGPSPGSQIFRKQLSSRYSFSNSSSSNNESPPPDFHTNINDEDLTTQGETRSRRQSFSTATSMPVSLFVPVLPVTHHPQILPTPSEDPTHTPYAVTNPPHTATLPPFAPTTVSSTSPPTHSDGVFVVHPDPNGSLFPFPAPVSPSNIWLPLSPNNNLQHWANPDSTVLYPMRGRRVAASGTQALIEHRMSASVGRRPRSIPRSESLPGTPGEVSPPSPVDTLTTSSRALILGIPDLSTSAASMSPSIDVSQLSPSQTRSPAYREAAANVAAKLKVPAAERLKAIRSGTIQSTTSPSTSSTSLPFHSPSASTSGTSEHTRSPDI